jgi:hypothetical protein
MRGGCLGNQCEQRILGIGRCLVLAESVTEAFPGVGFNTRRSAVAVISKVPQVFVRDLIVNQLTVQATTTKYQRGVATL